MIEAIKKHKRIVAAVVILILTAAIELVCNFPAIRGGYDNLDLTKYITVEKEGNKEKYVISYSSSQKFYIKELKLSGSFPKEYSYTIKTKEYNSFDKESEEYYSDTVNSWFSDFYTNLNKKVTSIEITLNKVEDAELTAVSCSNRFEINKYRILFFWALFSLIYCLFFEKKVYKKIECFFAIYAFIFGLLLVVYGQPIKNSWDESIHFGNAYTMAFGKNVEWTEAALFVKNGQIVSCNTKEEFAELRAYLNGKGIETVYAESKETILPSYTKLAYIPQAIFIRLGMILNLSFSTMYAVGKLGNLLLYIFVMFWAIHMAQTKKMFLSFLAVTPTALYLASSYTYDTVVFSFLILACVLWANMIFYPEREYSSWTYILTVLLFVIGCASKAVYIPMILLFLVIPYVEKKKPKKKVILWSGIIIILMLVMLTFVLPTLSNAAAGNITFGGDSRGGDTGVVRQIVSMIKHPWASVKLMLVSVFKFDNFRNLGYDTADNFFFGNLMCLNFAHNGILSDKWSAILLPICIILLLYKTPSETVRGRHSMSMLNKFIVLIAVAGTIFLVWLALYLDFTPVGAEYIAGVQARYYLPLLYLGALLFTGRKVTINWSEETITKLTYSAATLLGFALMYQGMLQGRII